MLQKDLVKRMYEVNGVMKETQAYKQIIVTGNLTRDLEVKRFTNKKGQAESFVSTGLANNGYGQNPETTFFNLSFFSKQGEIAQKLKLAKGTRILIVGNYNEREYTTKDGKSGISKDIVVTRFEILNFKKNDDNQTPQNTEVSQDDSEKYADFSMSEEFNF